ncbi:MAG: hypothetical protein M1819_005297 [Sarea resinae]|nr:MAG: hypothetical protein M1819_005297 [Sarea resinae]
MASTAEATPIESDIEHAPSDASSGSPQDYVSFSEREENGGEESRPDALETAASASSSLARRTSKRNQESNRSRRLRKCYSDGYRKLLNAAIEDVLSKDSPSSNSRLQKSQIGITTWTSEEKSLLFNALAKMGRANIRGIATAVRTKSEVEVRIYLQLLRSGIEEIQLSQPKVSLLRMTALPFAHELSDECVSALDSAAEALSMRQENAEIKQEKEKWGDSWLLTRENASLFSTGDGALEGGENVAEGVLAAATFFKLESFLELSERIYMSPAATNGECWQDLVEGDETPSIRATALGDFYTLAVDAMKQLIQTSTLIAQSRLRATDTVHSSLRHPPVVKGRDVAAAVKILGMKPHSNAYWAGVPRRCGLHVYDKSSAFRADGNVKSPLPYDEVEERLGGGHDLAERMTILRDSGAKANKAQLRSATQGGTEEQQDAESRRSSLEDAEMTGYTSGGEAIESAETPTSAAEATSSENESNASSMDLEGFQTYTSIARKNQRLRLQFERDEDEYAEAVDKHSSLLEEKQLWAMLDEEPPPDLTRRLRNTEIPHAPNYRRRDSEDLVDWMDRTDFCSEWELANGPLRREDLGCDIGISETGMGVTDHKPVKQQLVLDDSETSDNINEDEDDVQVASLSHSPKRARKRRKVRKEELESKDENDADDAEDAEDADDEDISTTATPQLGTPPPPRRSHRSRSRPSHLQDMVPLGQVSPHDSDSDNHAGRADGHSDHDRSAAARPATRHTSGSDSEGSVSAFEGSVGGSTDAEGRAGGGRGQVRKRRRA